MTVANSAFTLVGTDFFESANVGGEAAPTLMDLDGDTDPLFGVDGGDVEYFRNTLPVVIPAALDRFHRAPPVQPDSTLLCNVREGDTAGRSWKHPCAGRISTLGDAGNTITLSRIDALTGGAGTDVVTATSTGTALAVSRIEAVTKRYRHGRHRDGIDGLDAALGISRKGATMRTMLGLF